MALLPSIATVAVSAVMISLGLLLGREQIAAALRRRTVLAAALFAVIVPVPALAVAFVRLADLSGPVAAGIVLMSISPGAPVALRRAFEAGDRGSIAPALHLAIVLLAVVTVPVSIMIMNATFGVAFAISPWQVARQVFIAQLLPLSAGVAVRALWPARAAWLEPRLARVSNLLLVALLGFIVYALWPLLVTTGWMPAIGGAVLTLCALGAGSAVARRDVRPQAAIAAAMRNPGLALLIATVNRMPPTVTAAVIGYALGATVVVTLYLVWHRRARSE